MSRRPAQHLRRCLGALTALLLAATALGAITVAPADATTAATFANPAAVQGQNNFDYRVNQTPITIAASGTPTGSVYPSTIHFSGIPGATNFVEIKIELSHTAPDDLDLLLVSPTGKKVVLMSDAGGYTDFNGNLGFATINAGPVPDTTEITPDVDYAATNYTGNDYPTDAWPAPAPAVADPNASMDSLNGDSPDGDWKLFVRDDQDQDGGVINYWSLRVYTDALPTPAATYPAALPVSGMPGTVTDVNVTLHDLSWANSSDLDVMVVAPDGRKALVLSNAGGGHPLSNLTLTLDDEASTPVSSTAAPTSTRYRPTNYGGGDYFPAPAPDASTAGTPLSVFDGADPNGTWKLYVVDDNAAYGSGLLAGGWSLTITTNGSAPRVTSTTPKSGATGVLTYANVRAVASKALDPSTVTTKAAYLRRAGSTVHVAATVTYSGSTHTIVINPSTRLRAGTKYVATITTSVRDSGGFHLDQDPTKAGAQSKTWTFTTH